MPDETNRRNFLKKVALSAAGFGLLPSPNQGQSSYPMVLPAQTPQMPRKPLGSTGESLPILHLGTAQRMDSTYDKIMHRCYNEGINWIDTALGYGWGSSHLAIANFADQIGGRKKLWLTSKSSAWTVRGLIDDVDKCLDELKTDYLDLYLMHGINDPDYLARDYIQAGETLRRSGKIRFFGFSSHGGDVVRLMNRAVDAGGIDAILFSYNFRRYGDLALNKALDRCKSAGIGLIAMKTMGSVPNEAPHVTRFRSHNLTLAQAKLKSVWADDRIDSVVSEMSNIRQVTENAAAARSPHLLTAHQNHQLKQLATLTDHLACLGCSHLCEAEIQGQTAIADLLRFLMYAESYGKTERARELFHNLPVHTRTWADDDLKRASTVCPQKIDLPARLEYAVRILGNVPPDLG